ncbi:hypothetical protein AGMMS50233_04220 [Endomicrobiia bacterium]|nr:hypothetical protein AGMMS50233_04220 [Endomicrobiia bacterium]
MKKALIVFLVLLMIIGPSNKISAAKTTTQLQESEADDAKITITQRQEQEKQYRDNVT